MRNQGPVARLFGSLANTLLDLGLPRIRTWLRERVGPSADVDRVSTEGTLIHLDGVRLPIGPRGELVLERATAIITPARGIGVALPELRLHAFRGVLAFTGADPLRAEVAFVATPDADEAAWVAGELTILRATWSVKTGRASLAPQSHLPMEGRARLVVTSTTWSLEDGALQSGQAVVRFTGRGRTETSEGAAPTGSGAIDVAALVLDGARVGPFVDAIQAIVGQPLGVPPGVPLDARLDGTLGWDATRGGTCTLHVTAQGLDAQLTGEVRADGGGLAARATGDLSPAVPLREAGVPERFLPRGEDRVAFVIEATGQAARPDVQATFRTNELGFRLGRPRFQPPPLVARAFEVVVAAPRSAPANVRATFVVAGDARFAGEAHIDLGSPLSVTGEATLTTPRGAVALRPLTVRGDDLEGTRLVGRVAMADALRTNLFAADVRPTAHGAIDLDLAVRGSMRGAVLHGSIAAPQLQLAIASRPDVVPFVLEDARATVTLDPASLVLRNLSFNGYGGTFTGEVTIALDAKDTTASSPPALVLACHDAHASFVEAVARLARGKLVVRVERDATRPENELWIPRAARVTGKATLGADLALSTTLALTTPASSLDIAFRLAPDLKVDGTTIRGTLAIRDALTAGAFDTTLRPLVDGAAHVEAKLEGPIDDCTLSGLLTAPQLSIALHEGERPVKASPSFAVTDVSTLFRLDASKLVWHRCFARAYGGTLASSGVIGHGGAFVGLQATLAVRAVSLGELDVDDTGRKVAELARGRVAVDMRFDRQGTGAVTGRGDLCLDDGAFPLLARSKPSLAKYGLSPPAENAIAPATCTIYLHERGWSFCDARAVVPGCEATGRVDVSTNGVLDGGLVVTLGPELLERNAVTVLPSLLAEHLVVPVRITGSAAVPHIHADLAACFGNLVTDNRVSALLSEAASDVASLFTGKDPPRPPARVSSVASAPPPRMHPDPYGASARGDAAEEDALLRDLVASGADWNEIDERLDAHRRSHVRHRIG